MPILGTSPDAIDLAEDRDRFKRLLDKLGLKQPKNGIAYSVEQSAARRRRPRPAASWCARPTCSAAAPWRSSATRRSSTTTCSARCRAWSRPTSRRATRTTRPARSTRCWARTRCCSTATCRTRSRSTSTALCDGKDVFVAGIMEHIEEAGIHSGDSRLLAAAALAVARDHRRARARRRRRLALALERRRPDERAIRHQGRRRSTCWRSTRAPRARCRSSPR